VNIILFHLTHNPGGILLWHEVIGCIMVITCPAAAHAERVKEDADDNAYK
jgi:hypothetical protein